MAPKKTYYAFGYDPSSGDPLLDAPGLFAYYKADSGLWRLHDGTSPATTTGEELERWDDSSGNGRHCYAEDANGLVVLSTTSEPFYNEAHPDFGGKPAIWGLAQSDAWGYGSGTNIATGNFGFDTTSGFSIYFAGKTQTVTQRYYLLIGDLEPFGYGGLPDQVQMANNRTRLLTRMGGTVVGTTVQPTGYWDDRYILMCINFTPPNTVEIFLDNDAVTPDSSAAATPLSTYDSFYRMWGLVHSLDDGGGVVTAFYDQPHDASTRGTIFTYLNSFWSLGF